MKIVTFESSQCIDMLIAKLNFCISRICYNLTLSLLLCFIIIVIIISNLLLFNSFIIFIIII